MIIDSHHHLWAPQTDPGNVGYVWLRDIGAPKPFGDPTPIQRDYLIEEFLAEAAPERLAGSVHLQCDPKIPDPVAETAFIQRISEGRVMGMETGEGARWFCPRAAGGPAALSRAC